MKALVLRRDGRPAAEAAVMLKPWGAETIAAAGASKDDRWIARHDRADADGSVRFTDVPAGRWRVVVREPGLVPTWTAVDVRNGALVATTVTEPAGATVELAVVDADGDPVPFPTIAVQQPSGVAWVDLSPDDEQRLDLFAGANGRRTLAHVEPGDAGITVSHGGRSKHVALSLVEGATDRVTIALD